MRMRVEELGGGVELMAFHAMTRVAVRNLERNPGSPSTAPIYTCIAAFGQPTGSSPDPVLLIYQGRMHYDLLEPLKRSVAGNPSSSPGPKQRRK